MTNISFYEPKTITQFETAQWTRTFDSYSAEDYTLEYRFRGPGTGLNFAGTQDDDDADRFNVTLTPDNTSDLVAGDWNWQAWLTEIADTDITFVVARGSMTVLAGFDAGDTATVETRTPNKITLDNIRAAIAGNASSNVQEYQIQSGNGHRELKHLLMEDLLAAEKRFAILVANENRRAAGKGVMSMMRVGTRNES